MRIYLKVNLTWPLRLALLCVLPMYCWPVMKKPHRLSMRDRLRVLTQKLTNLALA